MITVKTKGGAAYTVDSFLPRVWTAGEILDDARTQFDMEELTTIELDRDGRILSAFMVVKDDETVVVS